MQENIDKVSGSHCMSFNKEDLGYNQHNMKVSPKISLSK